MAYYTLKLNSLSISRFVVDAEPSLNTHAHICAFPLIYAGAVRDGSLPITHGPSAEIINSIISVPSVLKKESCPERA